MIKIYDTMTRSLRDFVPLTENVVNMYVCGPTVYNYIHIGNARSAVAFDTIRRYFEYCGYTVNYISNFTDVDDKIIKAANEAGISTKELSDKFIAAFMEDTGQLGIKPATQNPRVINYMDEIIAFVSTLVDKGFAYVSEGDVYFRVAKSNNYAKLANKTLEDLEIGASGRTDIHGGGADLEFPHHTNEIAQSEAKTGKTFANYWMHNGFVNVDNEKMSKSLGNFVTVHDMLQTVDGQVLRFFLATQQYRKPINFTEKAIHDAEVNLKYLKNTHSLPLTEQVNQAELQTYLDTFQEAMDDDFNTANGVTVLFDMAKWINSGNYDQTVKDAFEKMLQVFGIVFEEEVLDEDIEKLIEERQAARANKDFATADRIRDELAAQGIKLLDTKEGVRWTRD